MRQPAAELRLVCRIEDHERRAMLDEAPRAVAKSTNISRRLQWQIVHHPFG
jgi:hypothetical protein